MGRSERWSTAKEIKAYLQDESTEKAGPILYVENGKKYCDTSEAHIGVIGRTGKGKSQCVSLPFMREIFQKGESLIMLDPKGEGYQKNACYIPENYQTYCVDFRNLRRSPTCWNPLSMPYQLYRSEDPDKQDIASSMLSDLWNGVYPDDGQPDKFWTNASANLGKGLTYGLFETAEEDQINLNHVACMLEQAESQLGSFTLARAFYDMLPHNSLARRNLASYVTGPNETRASIHSVAASGLEVFSRSKGLMEMLSEDTLHILDLDVNRPFALIIIIPDETDVYDRLAGLLVSQVSQHLVRIAQERGGKLPIRVNIILEELGSVGQSISNLPKLMVAGRSRNMRLMLILQSYEQLVDVYGKSKAKTICSSIGITIGFSTNCWETLVEWSQRCGKKQVENNGRTTNESLITPTQLAAVPTGTALIMVDSRHKYITRLPFYDELYDQSDWKPPIQPQPIVRHSNSEFEFQEKVKQMRREWLLSKVEEQPTEYQPTEYYPLLSHVERPSRITLQRPEKGKNSKGKYKLIIQSQGLGMVKQVKMLQKITGERAMDIYRRMCDLPCSFVLPSKKKAKKVAKCIRKSGGKAKIQKM